jgi:ribosome recycling factor
MSGDLLKDIEARMEKSVKALEKEFVTIRTGRANPALLDHVTVDAYGQSMPISQVATVTCPEPRLIVVQPWDKSTIQAIEKGILKADLSINPVSDGTLIRLQIPELTEERRKELSKVVKAKAEDSKVAIRNIRRDGNDTVKAQEKSKEIPEDESKQKQDQIQKLTDKYIEKVQKLAENKEKEIMSI